MPSASGLPSDRNAATVSSIAAWCGREDRDASAVGSQSLGRGATHTLAAAADDCGAVAQSEIHRRRCSPSGSLTASLWARTFSGTTREEPTAGVGWGQLMQHDLVIRGGTVIDGTGGPRVTADVAVDGGVIVDVGLDVGAARRTIDADGLLVTPGFVDVHTHYDAQVAWDPYVTPTSWHGVTTAIMGNCGVGFAPVKAEHREWLISLMEGVEDIPAAVLGAGLPWGWETYGEYLDVLDRDPRAIDIGGMVTHAATRVYVMAERGADHRNQPTDDDVESMSKLVAQALEAGALGFSTSRSRNHKTRDGDPIASLNASERELLGCADGLRRAQRGLIEIAADFVDNDITDEFSLFRALAERSGRPVSLPMTPQHHQPERHRRLLDLMAQAGADGLQFSAQVPIRPVGVMIGLENRLHPFFATATYQSVAALPLVERLPLLRQPDYRSRIVAEAQALPAISDLSLTFALGEPLDYEPDNTQSIAAKAAAQGVDPLAYAYDLLVSGDGCVLVPPRQFVR